MSDPAGKPLSRGLVFLAIGAVVVVSLVVFMLARSDGPRHGGRYDEIADLINDNLHFGRHFTWAVTADTIKAVRPHVSAADAVVLGRMLADERGRISVAAGGLLVMLGASGEAALKQVEAEGDIPASMHARDALLHLTECGDPAVINLDRALCP